MESIEKAHLLHESPSPPLKPHDHENDNRKIDHDHCNHDHGHHHHHHHGHDHEHHDGETSNHVIPDPPSDFSVSHVSQSQSSNPSAVINIPPDPVSQQPAGGYASPITVLDPFSVPSLSTTKDSVQSDKRQNYFDGGSEGIGPPAYASDLIQDDMEGSDASSPYVAFSASTVLDDKKLFNTASLGFGALLSPVKESVIRPPMAQSSPSRCQKCGAYANLYCLLVPQTGEWQCSLCGHGNDSGGDFMLAEGEDYSSWPELNCRVVEYHDVEKRYSSAADTALGVPLVFLIDDSLDDVYLQQLKSTLLSVLESLPPLTRVGLITYGSAVSVYQLEASTNSGVVTADMFPGHQLLDATWTNDLLYGSAVYLSPLQTCLSSLQAIVASLRPYRGNLPEPVRQRCLGPALDVALALVRGPAKDLPRSPMKRAGGSSRVVVCGAGHPTAGPGAVNLEEKHSEYPYHYRQALKVMEGLGREAKRLEATIDLLFAGTVPVNVPLVHTLARLSGGVLLIHDDFQDTFSANLARAVSRVVGVKGRVEVRSSPSMAVTHVVGPAEACAEESVHGAGYALPGAAGGFLEDRGLALAMGSVEECQGVALSLALNQSVSQPHVYFQFAVRYTTLAHSAVVRVITVRLHSTHNVTTYLQSVDDEVIAILIAKRAVLAADSPSSLRSILRTLDSRLQDITNKFGTAVPRSRFRRFPNELPRLPELLYHLRRGALLGGLKSHEGERQVARSLFLNADLDLSLRMLMPQLLLYRPSLGVQEIPPYTLALHCSNALVLDNGTHVLLWLGSELEGDAPRREAAEGTCMAAIAEITQNRFPAPRFMSFAENSSASRYLMSRLVPAHKDSISDQETRFPFLRELQVDERTKLRSKLLPTDELSFCEWMRSLRIIPPDPIPLK